MEFLYFAYECADKSLYFTETLEQCREQAHEYPDKPLPIYAYQFESPDHHDVLNILASMEQPSTALIDACLVERTLLRWLRPALHQLRQIAHNEALIRTMAMIEITPKTGDFSSGIFSLPDNLIGCLTSFTSISAVP